MAKISETELRRKLKKLEVSSSGSGSSIERVGDQYEYDKTVIYIAYASALSNLSSGTIPSQSDASDFQFSPYTVNGTLLAYRGYFINKSIYQSGDPTDYTWEATSGASGFTSSERYYTTNTGLIQNLGNPSKPGLEEDGITEVQWTILSPGTVVPTTAVYLAERFTLTTTGGAVTSNWDIKAVGKHIDTSVVSVDGIKATNMDLDGTLNVTADSGAIRWNKTSGDDVTNSGLYIGNNAAADQRIVLGTSDSFIYYDGNRVYTVGTSSSPSLGTEINYWTSGSGIEFFISGLLSTITWRISAGGGGGGGAGGYTGAGAGSTGGSSSIVVKTSGGSVRTTLSTAAGGAGGAYNNDGSGGCSGSRTGEAFALPSGFASTPFSGGTGGTAGGGSWHNVGGGNGGRSAGGGGAGTDIDDPSYKGGGGGCKGAHASGVYTIVDNTDILSITVGGGGSGSTNAGSGGAGAVWIQGAT